MMKLKTEHRRRVLLSSLLTMVALWLLVASVAAQDFRGSITGRVTDPSGGVVPGALITVTNTATNVSNSATTNEAGAYSVLYLPPGQYTVVAEAKGFKRLVHTIEVRVGDKLTLDLPLEVGNVSESVSVTTDAPLLETTSSSAGQVIDRRRISELPLSDGNPFTLVRLAPGIGYIGDLKFSRPFDNNGSSDFIADGTGRAGGHEFTLDGIPNTDDNGSSGNRVAFIPPADAVQEFKVETASFDAQQGHGAGASVNVVIKSGTNKLHGTVYEFVRNDVLSANDFFLNRAGKPRDALRYNRYGGTVGGPVMLPRFGIGGHQPGYDGRNKSFFFFAYEGLKDVFPEPRTDTVPTLAQRGGNFSALLGSQITTKLTKDGCAGKKDAVVAITNRDGSPALAGQIYNPFTGTTVSRCNPLTGNVESHVERLPFAGNLIPGSLFSSVATSYLQFYPLPNQAGDSQGRNNFISPNPRTDTFHSESYRFDQTISQKQRFFVRYSHNNRLESRNAWSGVVNGLLPTGNFLTRRNNSVSYDHNYLFSSTTILDVRLGFSRFLETNVRQHEGAFTPASLGFASQSSQFFGSSRYLPRFQISGSTANSPLTPIGDSVGDIRTHNIYALQPTLTRLSGNHSFKFGYDFRIYRENSNPSSNTAGRYDFGTNFTKGPLDNSTSAATGQEFAAFLLGSPTGGLIDRNAARSNQTVYHGIFFHDDWKVNHKLTLNLGLRYEMEGATTERFNRNIRGFDPNVSSPIEAAAKAAYAAKPIPEIPASSFSVKGGLLFADAQHRGFWNTDRNNFQPRIGFAFQLNEKTVMRGGFGVYMAPYIIDGVNQTGFSQSTSIVPTLNNGLTFAPACATCGNLFNPFPSGVADPPGATLGAGTFLGRSISFIDVNRQNGMTQRWEFGAQRELPGKWLVEADYIGSRAYDLTTDTNILNAVPRQYLSTSPIRDDTVINFLGASVANPFQNLIPGQTLNGSTTSRSQLLRPFPEFTGIASQRFDGKAVYHAGQFRMERRFTKGYSLLASYTWSKVIDETFLLNDTDTKYERRISDLDIPQRLVVSGIWEIPFGKGRRWGNNWHGVVDTIVGGWQFQGIYQWQSGRPINLEARNIFFNGDPSTLRAQISGGTVDGTFDISGFYFTDAAVQTNGVVDPVKQRADTRIRLASNIRTLPSRLPGFRGQPLNLWDLSLIKNFSVTERLKFQLRGEFLNAFNHPQFGDPNTDPTNSSFGKTTSQTNLPRNVQIGLKLIF